MNKKIILLPACLLLLASCGGGNEKPSIQPSVSPIPSVPSVVPPSTPDTPSVDPSTPVDPGTPASRHADYLAICNTDNQQTTTIRVKVLGFQSYPDSESANFYFQEDKYGYFINNIPKSEIEVGKSYEITAQNYYGSKAKTYPCLQYNSSNWECTEIADVATTQYVIGDTTTDKTSQEYIDGQYSYITLGNKVATVSAVNLTSGYPSFSFTLDGDTSGTTYKWNSNNGLAEWDAIIAKLGDLEVGDKLHKIEGGWGGNYSGATATDIMGSSFEQVGANPESISVSGQASIQQYQERQLVATPVPTHSIGNVVWSSSNESVATVDQNGVVTGVSLGTTTITVKNDQFATITDSMTLTVTEPIAPTSITIEGSTEVIIGRTATYSVSAVTPTDANQDITWASSNSSVASIDEDGILTALAVGTTQITAVSVLDDTIVSNSITVTVNPVNLPITGVINDAIPTGWKYITNNPSYPNPGYYGDGGLKLNFLNMGIESPQFVTSNSVTVGVVINAFYENSKSQSSDDAPILVVGLNAAGEEVARGEIETLVEDQLCSVTITGTEICVIKVTYQNWYYNGTKCCNIDLGSVSVSA